ncbi:MAG: hypothetical protein K6D38_09705 [Pseudobutyrivibrio sp.]|nr:hypothetical protein [Pseudobutyrivibrio sp.]
MSDNVHQDVQNGMRTLNKFVVETPLVVVKELAAIVGPFLWDLLMEEINCPKAKTNQGKNKSLKNENKSLKERKEVLEKTIEKLKEELKRLSKEIANEAPGPRKDKLKDKQESLNNFLDKLENYNGALAKAEEQEQNKIPHHKGKLSFDNSQNKTYPTEEQESFFEPIMFANGGYMQPNNEQGVAIGGR